MSTVSRELIFAAIFGGVVLVGGPAVAQHHPESHESHATARPAEPQAEIWTCSMHPQIRLPKPGRCPICGMDLIPVAGIEVGQSVGPQLKMSKSAEKLAQVQTSTARYQDALREVRLVGNLDYDETRVKHITAWVSGRIDRLYVDFTGISVEEGDHMVYLYSPDLLSAQEELIQSRRALRRIGSGASAIVRDSSVRSLEAAREKLVLLGLTDEQVQQIEAKGNASEWVTIYSPIGGIVVKKHVSEGQYVKTGSQIYTIADLNHLWLHLDAYQSDLPWIRYGQEVEFFTEALPGETFSGVVSFIQPFLDSRSRTVKVRVNVDNQKGRLKPGMFVTAKILARLSAEGRVNAPSFSGKYVCPMHPEVVRDAEGNCPICGMKLKKAETLPFIHAQERYYPPLVVPASAPLVTGKRAIVYVRDPNTGVYSSREVVLGPKAGEFYVVRSGLRAGEEVVTRGAFKLDADLQIRGLSSMMNPKGVLTTGEHKHMGH